MKWEWNSEETGAAIFWLVFLGPMVIGAMFR